ncbi:MAG: sulfide/dihydroorotate dehydrogenase-like FAD/NAD-binding protein [Dehalococcoidia bacterium]|nr:sulfide/dihydroorotate dehydrogenase-like FAD/NAD-binding protein [Dehalococcoidia bacterium]MDD5494556.1 sulfide/dihydroorotate dehydrogenase-like FAD/NAD-binding protein [Dehalococcoidia bacterium]
MYKILSKEKLTPVIDCLKVEAPAIAKKARAGQFVIIRIDEVGERVPLTLADWDAAAGTITLVAMEIGASTCKLGGLQTGGSILNLVGPLGLPSEIEKFGTVVCVGGGVGIAPVHPIARSLRQAGNKVISIIGARNKDLLFWEDKMRLVSDELIVTTDDGSYARKGLVTEPLKEILEREKVARVVAIGPAIMMKFCSLTTKPFNVPTVVSLNSIMVDGTGMCGCCRLSVGGQTRFACVDGPEFDGHQVDWDIVFDRQKVYLKEEKEALDRWKECQCQKS